CTRENHPNLIYALAHYLQRVEKRGTGDDGRSMLVVVEHRDAQRLPKLLLYVEAVGSTNVLQVDPANGRLQKLAEPDYVVRVLGANLEVEDVEVGELLEQVAVALHHRLACKRTYVAESEYG